MEEYIKLLELPDEFYIDDLKRAYRNKVLQYHPDKASNEAERIGYEATMKKLNEANAYIKEYLENHGGKYSKLEYYNTSSNSNDDTTYSEESAEEETEETYEDNDDEEVEEEYDDENSEEALEDDKAPFAKFNNMSLLEKFAYITKAILFPKFLDKELKKQGKSYIDVLKELNRNTIIAIIGGCLFAVILLYKETSPQIHQEETVSGQDKVVVLDNTTQFGNYMNEVQRKIKMNWSQPKTDESLKTVVSFTIYKDGRLNGEPIIKSSSGNNNFDYSCVNAINLTAPFKQFPKEITKDTLDMDFTFENN